MKQYPIPREDVDNAAFLTGWRQGRLVLQRCAGCGRSFFYPRPMCPHCWSERLENHVASGRGRIVAYSLVYRPNDPAFNDEVPIVLAEVELSEGATLIARIIEIKPEAVRSDLAVELPPAQICARYSLPVFRPSRVP